MSTIGSLVGQIAGGGNTANIPAAATTQSNNSFGNILNSVLTNAAPIIGAIKGNQVSTVYVSNPSDTLPQNYITGSGVTEPPKAKEGKPKTGLIIGIAAAVLALGVVLYFVFKK